MQFCFEDTEWFTSQFAEVLVNQIWMCYFIRQYKSITYFDLVDYCGHSVVIKRVEMTDTDNKKIAVNS